MDVIVRDVLVEANPTGGVWYIPFVFLNATDLSRKYIGSDSVTLTAFTMANNNGTISPIQLSSDTTSTWIQPSGNSDVYTLCIPSSITFLEYLVVHIELLSSGDYTALPILLYIRKASSSSGSSGSSVDPDDIAEAVWNYGADEGDETVTDRTLSTTVEVNPSAIAQAVWNYSVAEPASGTLGTRTLTTAIPSAASIATAVLTTDVSDESVETDEYTLKHLVMASQRSKVVTENGETVWKIMGNRLSGETGEEIVIATRTLTLNANGAITQTM